MISHEHKVLFYHIPRTGGTTIENLFIGKDMAFFNHRMKHPSMEDFMFEYKEWWKDYYKFSVIRNPYEWVRSMYSLEKSDNKDFNYYCENFRFNTKLTNEGFPYENIIGNNFIEFFNNKLDHIFRFEDLVKSDFGELRNKFGINKKVSKKMPYEHHHKHKKPQHTLDTFNIIKEKFKNDIETFYPEIVNISYDDVLNKRYGI